MKVSKHDPNVEMGMDMTPLIDCVFLLIVFFMIITDLTQADLESLQLPEAKAAVEDKPDATKVRPVLNIPVSGNIIYKRDKLYLAEQDKDDMSRLEKFLLGQSKLMSREHFNKEAGTGPMIPADPLMIRADKNTEFKYIQRVMEICGKKDIQIWKLELGAKDIGAKEEGAEEKE